MQTETSWTIRTKGTAALMRTFYILSKYFTQGSQNNLQLP